MVSRKKLKGKARKAAKAEAAAGVKTNRAFLTGDTGNGCTHGWNRTKYPADHVCYKFIGDVLRVFKESSKSGEVPRYAVDMAVLFTEDIFPDVWSDSESLEWAAAVFISLGTYTVMQGDGSPGDYLCKDCGYVYTKGPEAWAKETDKYKCPPCGAPKFRFKFDAFDLCATAMGFSELLKQHVACYHVGSQPLIYTAKIDDLLCANERRTVSYLKKRIPCKCLNAKYKAVKSLPKMYTCCNMHFCSLPYNSVNLSAMMSCGGCRRIHYCSEECQAADWEEHRYDCKEWRKWNAENCSK